MSETLANGADAGPASAPARRSPGARGWLVVPIVALFLGVFVGGHWYIADRLVIAPALPAPLGSAALVLLGGLALTLFLQPIAERYWPVSVERLLVWPASLWMGVAFLLLIALMTTDLMLLLLGAAGGVEPLLAARVRAAAVVALVLPATLLAVRRGLAPPAIERVEIRLDRWPAALDGFRIVQISDIHFGPILDERFAAHLRDEIDRLEPDLVAITGDLVDGRVHKVGHTVEPLAGLSAPQGCWFVTGNHDHYSKANDWVARVEALGIEVLRNTHRVIEARGARFVLAGVDDHRSRQMPGEGGEDLDAALADAPADLPILLLAHDPTTFRRASERGIDLQLSGHTHGGQIWPFGYLVRIAVPWVAGLYRRGAAQVYVSRGTGFWGPPMRLGAPAEITQITLRRAAAEGSRAAA